MQIIDLKQRKIQENAVSTDTVQFAHFPQPYVVIGHRPVGTESVNPTALPPEKPKRKCCPW